MGQAEKSPENIQATQEISLQVLLDEMQRRHNPARLSSQSDINDFFRDQAAGLSPKRGGFADYQRARQLQQQAAAHMTNMALAEALLANATTASASAEQATAGDEQAIPQSSTEQWGMYPLD